MTLQDFFDLISSSPSLVIFYFIAFPLTAFLASIFGNGEGDISPWKYLYSFLVYGVCIPGIFSLTLNVYMFLFDRQSILDANIFTQILPILVMIITLVLVRRNTCFEDIPGFGRLGSLIMVITAIISIMWVLDKTHIIVFSMLPFWAILAFIAVVLILIRFGTKKMFA